MSEQTMDIADATTKIYSILNAFQIEERKRIIAAVLTLFGDNISFIPEKKFSEEKISNKRVNSEITEKDYFDKKQPTAKIEELATAARYREEYLEAETHEKDSLEQTIKNARRNFDSKNFNRDLNNARAKGLFTRDKEIKLSYLGQGYIDKLPERTNIKAKSNKKRAKKSDKKTNPGNKDS